MITKTPSAKEESRTLTPVTGQEPESNAGLLIVEKPGVLFGWYRRIGALGAQPIRLTGWASQNSAAAT